MFKAYYSLIAILFFCFISAQLSSQVTVSYSDAMGIQGDTITIDITVDGFTDVRNLTLVTKWNADHLQYISHGNIHSSLPSGEINFGTPDNTGFDDRVNATMSNTEGEFSIDSDDVFFSIDLRIISAQCLETSVDTFDGIPHSDFFIVDGGDVVGVRASSNPGTVSMNGAPDCGGGGNGDNVLSVGTVEGAPDSEVCVPIIGSDLNDMAAFNTLRLDFDPDELTYTGFNQLTSPEGEATVNDEDADIGQLIMIYQYIGSDNKGITSDETVLFELCFEVTGDCEESSTLSLSEGEEFFVANSEFEEIDYELEDGAIEINCCAIELESVDITPADDGANGAIDISISGGTPPYDFSWSNGETTEDIEGLEGGSYSVTVSDSDCTITFGPFSVTAGALSISGEVSHTCLGQDLGAVVLTVDGGTPPYDFEWSCSGDVDPNTGSISGLGPGDCTVTVTDADGTTETATFTIQESDEPLSASVFSVEDDIDNDGNGSITLSVDGGWGDYEFNWDDGSISQYPNENPLENIYGGEYYVTVTDGGGCVVELGPIEVEGLRILGRSLQPVACVGDNNGAIEIEVIGGSGDYTYDWSCDGTVDEDGSISGVTAGDCTLTVTDTDDNSMTSATFTVLGPDNALTISSTSNCSNGNDGSILTDVSGGTTPYTYDWNTSPAQTGPEATGLAPGQFTVIVTDSTGCQVMSTSDVRDCSEQDCYTSMEVITPNDDGFNDLFVIECAGATNNTLTIYTRWGQEVISFSNYQNNWDGRDDGGNLVDEDTYYWVLENQLQGGGREIHKGAVTVLYNLR